MTSRGSSDRPRRIRARLAEVCGGDEDLRGEVESLLEAEDARGSGVRRAHLVQTGASLDTPAYMSPERPSRSAQRWPTKTAHPAEVTSLPGA